MLIIHFGQAVNGTTFIQNSEIYFKNTYEPDWINDPLTKCMIQAIDGVDVLDVPGCPNILYDFNQQHSLAPTDLCGGTQTVMLMTNDTDGYVYNGNKCGDNLAPFILAFSKNHTMNMELNYPMDFGKDPFDIMCANDGSMMHNMLDVLDKFNEFVKN